MQPGSWNYILRVGFFYIQLVQAKLAEFRATRQPAAGYFLLDA